FPAAGMDPRRGSGRGHGGPPAWHGEEKGPPPAVLRCAPAAVAALGGAGPVRPPSSDRREGHDGRGRLDKGTSPWRPIATIPISTLRTPHHRQITSLRSFSSMAIVPSRTNPTPGRCRKPTPSAAPWPTSSTR